MGIKKGSLIINNNSESSEEYEGVLIFNIVNNFLSNCSYESLSNHFGVSKQDLGNLDFLIKTEFDTSEYMHPYRDWDMHD